MSFIIGMDFGNCYSYISPFALNLSSASSEDKPIDLLPSSEEEKTVQEIDNGSKMLLK